MFMHKRPSGPHEPPHETNVFRQLSELVVVEDHFLEAVVIRNLVRQLDELVVRRIKTTKPMRVDWLESPIRKGDGDLACVLVA